ncbi:aspartate aminotransferase family protein [Halobacillus sp. B23F22_1]|uniref:aspartate aminotransferase family protein n=1 Tax=Halobacillus sp. B23F22_1 TaxID=3459514 RepID=UPI00373E45AD
MTSLLKNKNLSYISPVWPQFTGLEIEYGKGIYLYDIDGKKYLDFTSGIGVTNTGHCHDRVVRTIQNQAERLIHGQSTVIYNQPMLKLASKINEITPPQLNCSFFTNSGSEAVESAIKLARHATNKTNIICFQGGYHGRSIGAMSVTTAKSIYRNKYQPLMAGVSVSPFPYSYRYQQEEDSLEDWCIKELEYLLKTQSSPDETAAMILEPVLGEGGYVVPPKKFLQRIRDICDHYGILLIFDEVQSGFGRTGEFFAFEHFDVQPDILVVAKGLASGLPLSGIVSSRELMEEWIPGSHGGTYGPNPVAASAAIETIKIIEEEKLVENSASLGRVLLKSLYKLKNEYPFIGEVRGLGLMVGCEFSSHHPSSSKIAEEVRKKCLEQGLILLTCGSDNQVIRWIPPLTLDENSLERALKIFENALIKVEEIIHEL